MSPLFSWFRKPQDPDPSPEGDPIRLAQVEAVLTALRPIFAADGGDMLLLSVDTAGWVTLRAKGACSGCGASDLTIRGALEPRLRTECDWFAGVTLL